MSAVLRRVRRSGNAAGFTLVELLVVVILLGVVGAIVSSGIISSLRADRRTRARVAVTADLTTGVDRMSKQLRVAAPVIDFSAESVTVQTYRDGLRWRHTFAHDTTAKTVTETIQRFPSESAVTPDQTTTKILLTGVTNDGETPMFRYYDKDGTVAGEVDEVARVVLTLVETPFEQGPIRFETSINLRNYRET